MTKDYIEEAMGATAPWNGPDALARRPKRIQTYDSPEEIARCERCPMAQEDCGGSDNCWYRLGKPLEINLDNKVKRKRKPTIDLRDVENRMPAGYDEERLKAAMVHNYLQEDIAKALGISKYMLRKWLAWRERMMEGIT